MKLKKILSIILAVIALIIFILWVMNPSYTRFKEYAADVSTTHRKPLFKRTSNYIIFSIYQKQIVTTDGDGTFEIKLDEEYIGFMMNFYKIRKTK